MNSRSLEIVDHPIPFQEHTLIEESPILYVTNDPHLAAFLFAETGQLHQIKRLSIKKVEYHFIASRELHTLIRVFWRGDAIWISPLAIFTALASLKRRHGWR